jgi:FkbM family methyltransferase
MESTLKRIARRLLAKVPWIYLFVLKTFHRGSVEKYFYLSIVQQGDVVIDVGANVGYFTMLFADLTGERGQVHAFEPIPSTFEELLRNIRRFPGYKGVYLNCAAVGDSQRRTAMLLPRDDHGQAALVRHQDGSWKDAADQVRSIDVQMIRFDDYAASLGRIDFIKCDVEGAELLFLRGAESTLRRCRPRLSLEMDERWMKSFGWSAIDVFQLLRQIGYAHFYHVGPETKPIVEECFSGGEVLCCWKDRE